MAMKRLANLKMDVKIVSIHFKQQYIQDVLWGQQIKLIQVASSADLRENQ